MSSAMYFAVLTSDFDFALPPELIAQVPAEGRTNCRLLVMERRASNLQHRHFSDLTHLFRPDDALILNNSRVIRARLRAVRASALGVNHSQGARIEILLLEEVSSNEWWAMVRPGKRTRPGTRLRFLDRSGVPTHVTAEVADINAEGHRLLTFQGTDDVQQVLEQIGEVPLPPYIERSSGLQDKLDAEMYQTVFAQSPGSVAAPTAGLHFSTALLDDLKSMGIRVGYVTLHVGFATFAPVKTERVVEHKMHEERYQIDSSTVELCQETRRNGGRVIAAGTTTLRVLESVAARNDGHLIPSRGRTNLFIYPPWSFNVVDALITNFHLPRSTLLMLVSAFGSPGRTDGVQLVKRAYAEAISHRYQFFSYGDAMLIL